MRLVRPGDAVAMAGMVEALREEEPNYVGIGSTLAGEHPQGYGLARFDTVLGHGAEHFQRARIGLQQWEAHHLAGVRVYPPRAEIRTGTPVIVTLGTPLVALAAPCRIVRVVDEPDRWGFAYGTLRGHPEEGEELFVVSISPDETVRFDITVFSRPGSLLVRLAGPIGRGVQTMASKGYLRGLRRFVARPT
jgi:uncharacterized protein (UPF0548 family)